MALIMVLKVSAHDGIFALPTDVWWSAFSVRIITCSHQLYRISVHLNSWGIRCTSLYPSIWFIPSAISLVLCWVQNATCPMNLLWGLGHYCWYIWAYTVLYILSRYLTLRVFRETDNITRLALLSLGKPAYKAILWQWLTAKLVHCS